MHKSLLIGASCMALLVTPLLAQTQKSKSVSDAAQTFVTKAANGGMFEVESSKMASDKATRQDVKSFAQKMIDDHGKANKELEDIATRSGATVADKMDQKHQSQVDKLKSSSASAFDKAYLDAQNEAHKEAATLFTGYSKNGDNAELKSFAAKTLPVIQGHQSHLKELEKGSSAETGKSTGTSGSK